MIAEDYVSFEVAKLLKEKGFSENTEHENWYVIKQFSTGCHWNSCTYKVGSITREYNDDCCISMPTLQMAMKWLREVHNMYIVVKISHSMFHDIRWYFDIYTLEDNDLKILKEQGEWCKVDLYNSYEEACEAAIKYTLEILI